MCAMICMRPNGVVWPPLNQWSAGSPQWCQSAFTCAGGTTPSPSPPTMNARSRGIASGNVSGECTRYAASRIAVATG